MAQILQSTSHYRTTALITISVFAALATGLFVQYKLSTIKLERSADHWESDLAQALASGDWLSVKRIGRDLYNPAFGYLTVESKGDTIYSFPSEIAPESCFPKNSIALTHYGQSFGSIEACYSLKGLLIEFVSSSSGVFAALTSAAIFMMFGLWPILRYRRSLIETVQELEKWSDSATVDKLQISPINVDKNDEIHQRLLKLVKEGVEASMQAARESERADAAEKWSQLITQLAHDIRSPLAALKVIARNSEFDTSEKSTEQKNLINAAVSRIQEIAGDLLLRHRNDEASPGRALAQPAPVLTPITEIQNACAAVIMEKKIKYSGEAGYIFKLLIPDDHINAFVSLSTVDFKRSLSNLIDNSVEAFLKPEGTVLVCVETESQYLKVSVADNGPGIPENTLATLAKKGATYGKAQGTGLGLYHAKSSVELWGGTFQMNSHLGRGTEILLRMPLVFE